MGRKLGKAGKAKYLNRKNQSPKLSRGKLIAIYERQIKSSISLSEQTELLRRIEILKNGSGAEKTALRQVIRATKQDDVKIRSSLPSKKREKGRWASIVGGGSTGLKR